MNGRPAPLIDALHRTLWLVENRSGELPSYLRRARLNQEKLRLVAEALSGPVLTAQRTAETELADELSALHKLVANWRGIVDERSAPRPSTRQDQGQTEFSFLGDD